MGGFFGLENGFVSTMGKVFDILLLSFLWVLFCIPVVTMGAATTALYYTTAKVLRRNRGYVFQEFWSCFKENFVTSTIYTVILLVMGIVFYFNFKIIGYVDGTLKTFLYYVYGVMLFMILTLVIYIFPVLSRFTRTRVETVKMAMILAMRHLPYTLLMIVSIAVGVFIAYCIPPTLFFVPAVTMLCVSFVMEKVFRNYMPKPEEDADEEHLEWYMTF